MGMLGPYISAQGPVSAKRRGHFLLILQPAPSFVWGRAASSRQQLVIPKYLRFTAVVSVCTV